MAYLVCDKCGGYYELQEGDSAEDFESCECGGNLRYVENIDENTSNLEYPETQESPKEANFMNVNGFPKENARVPFFLIVLGSIPMLYGIMFRSNVIFLLGVFNTILGLVFLFIRIIDFERRLNEKYLRGLYLLIGMQFIILSIVSFNIWIQIIYVDMSTKAKFLIPIFILFGIISGISMFWKSVDPYDSRNSFDPPIY